MYFGIAVALILFLPIIVMSLTDIEKRSPYAIVLRGILVTFAALILFTGIAAYMGKPLGAIFMDAAAEAAKIVANDESVLDRLGLTAADIPDTERALLLIYGAVNALVPAFCLICVSISAYVSYIILFMLRGSSRFRLPQLPAVRYFTWPPDLMFGCLLLVIPALFINAASGLSGLAVYENFLTIFRVALEFQGIAVYLFYAYSRKFPLLLKGGVLAILLVTAFGRIFLLILGLIDYIFGLRAKMLLKT